MTSLIRDRPVLYRAACAQHVERDAMALVRRRNPAIERYQQQHVANLVRRAAVGERAVEVDAKLGRAADRRGHGDRGERFHLERQRGAAPDVAIGIGVDHVLQRLAEGAESLGSLLHRFLAEYLAAKLQSLLVQVARIHCFLSFHHKPIALRSTPAHPPSLPGLTRQSILFAKSLTKLM